MNEILFICTGNTCRSPMAEGLYRAKGGEEKTGLGAGSAGLMTQDGLTASQNAILAARALGADLTAHRARQLTREMAEKARYLVCMTGAHYDTLCQWYPALEEKIFTLLPDDVDDPFGGSLEVYEKTAAQIEQGVSALIARLST